MLDPDLESINPNPKHSTYREGSGSACDLESMIRVRTGSFRIENTEGLSIRKLPPKLLNLGFSQSFLPSDTGTFEIPNKKSRKTTLFHTVANPHWSNADPDPAFQHFGNVDPDP
jgi:hypothetical protein